MTDIRKAAEMALEALEEACEIVGVAWAWRDEKGRPAITALRERLAQPEMQPCAGRNCGSTNPNLHSAECFEDYEKSTGMAQSVKEPVAWKRIETAPKTGRKVILFYLNRNNFPRTVMARWLTDDEAAETDTDCVGLEGGWYECIDNWDDYTEVAIHEGEPTHWMPLPPAPTSEGKLDVA